MTKKVKTLSRTRVDRWTVRKLAAAFGEQATDKVKLEMPVFQRGVVWSAGKKSDLIRSLKAGYPVGSLLFYRQAPNKDGVEVCLLIDGLQRTTAIRDYSERPLEYLGVEDIPREELDRLRNSIEKLAGLEISRQHFDVAITDWMSATRTLEAEDGFDAPGLFHALCEKLQLQEKLRLEKSLTDELRAFQKQLRSITDISEIEVPVLFYEGSQSELPEIFERINANGTKLTKYEVYAASWVDQEIHVKNEDVTEAIRRRYHALITQQNLAVNGVRADGSPHRLSLFDYLFGLGKYLSDRFPLLFGGSEDPTEMQSVAFALATVAHGLPLSRMKDLNTVMAKSIETSKIDPTDFERALIESAQFVTDALAPYIEIKLNAEVAVGGAHTDLQVASMVARALVGSYVPGTWEPRENAKKDREKLRLTFPRHYLIDVLQQRWRGSGDSRLYKMVWESEQGGTLDTEEGDVPATYYLSDLEPRDFERAIDQWFAEQTKLNQRSRAYVTSAAKVFLKFIYSGRITVKEEKQKTFELDHLFPVSRLVELVKDEDSGWPISAVSNLALFDWQTNREKSKLDLAQYLERVPEKSRQKKREDIERYLLLKLESAVIPKDAGGKDKLSRDDYVKFLSKRFKRMKEELMKSLGYVKSNDK